MDQNSLFAGVVSAILVFTPQIAQSQTNEAKYLASIHRTVSITKELARIHASILK